MSRSALSVLAASHVLGVTRLAEAVDTAHSLLDRGVYSYGLGELATWRGPADTADLSRWLLLTFTEFDVRLPDPVEALRIIVNARTTTLLERALDPRTILDDLYHQCYDAVERDHRLPYGDQVVRGAIDIMDLRNHEDYYLALWEDIERVRPDDRVAGADAEVLDSALQWIRTHRGIPWNQSWFSSTVIGLAGAIHEADAFDHLPILADALEEAGCDREEVLDHLRFGDVHEHFCWVVDAILRQSPTSSSGRG